MKIEHGKYYRTRDGQKVGPMEESEVGDPGGFWGSGLYRKDGTFGYGADCYCRDLDIIAEWTDETRDPEASSPYGDGNHPLPDVPPTTGTLRELNVKPGDVVEDTTDEMTFTVSVVDDAAYSNSKWPDGYIDKDDRWSLDGMATWRVISRASTYDPDQEVDQLRNERDALQSVIDGANMKRAYKDSAEAYNAIHAALTYEVEACLESCEYASAMKAADLMRGIEGHTDINHGDA